MIGAFRQIERAIGYRFKKKSLLRLALVHPSFRYESKDMDDDYQRLEFLGDAVLSCAIADHLYAAFPKAREGEMSKLRSRIASDRKLGEIALSLGLDQFILLGRGEEMSGGRTRSSTLGDVLEAIIGAAWLDGGLKAVRKILATVFLPILEDLKDVPDANNSKGNLQELCQKADGTSPIYTLLERTGPQHARRFCVEVDVRGQKWRATASNKRTAERLAAAQAYEALTTDSADPSAAAPASSPSQPHSSS